MASGWAASPNNVTVKNTFIDFKPEQVDKRERRYTDTIVEYESPTGKRRNSSTISTVEPVPEEDESEEDSCEVAPVSAPAAAPYMVMPPGSFNSPPGAFNPLQMEMGLYMGSPGQFPMMPMAPMLPMQEMVHAYAMQAATAAAALVLSNSNTPVSRRGSSQRDRANSGTWKSADGSGKHKLQWADSTPDASVRGNRGTLSFFDGAGATGKGHAKSTGKTDTVRSRGATNASIASEKTDSKSRSATATSTNIPAQDVPDSERTTLILRNLPSGTTRTSLLALLRTHGFGNRYNFVYMPTDFKNWSGFGYAFVNFTSNVDAAAAMTYFKGRPWQEEPDKICDAVWSSPHQGLESHIERYRNSPVMHEAVPEEAKPLLLGATGSHIKFPDPTKRIKPPRMRSTTAASSKDGSPKTPSKSP